TPAFSFFENLDTRAVRQGRREVAAQRRTRDRLIEISLASGGQRERSKRGGRRDRVFECLGNEVDRRQGDVRIVAGQLDLTEIGPAREQRVLDAAFAEELENVHEVGRGAMRRAALLAGAE